jgi:hypothetical protein
MNTFLDRGQKGRGKQKKEKKEVSNYSLQGGNHFEEPCVSCNL